MEYRRLGRTDLQVSRIGFGACAIGGYDYGPVSDGESIEAVAAAVDAGVNFFDTADVYGFGHSEEVLARGLGILRQDVIIATKGGIVWDDAGRTRADCSPTAITNAVHASLKRLQVDCIPLYQIHRHDGRTPIEDTLDALEVCRTAGKIRYVGGSNFTPSMTLAAAHHGSISALQLPFGLADLQHRDVLPEYHSNYDLGIVVYNVLGRGLLSARYSDASSFSGTDTRRGDARFSDTSLAHNEPLVEELRRLAKHYGVTPAQVAIQWVLHQPFVTSALVGTKRKNQLEENVAAVGWVMDRDHARQLEEIAMSRLLDREPAE